MKKIAVVYWSGTGNTELMADEIANAARDGGAAVDIFTPDKFTADMVSDYDRIAFGCPSMGDEVLEESEFDPMFTAVEKKLSGKEIALFGSFGWGGGVWMKDWAERCLSAGADVINGEGLISNGPPDESGIEKCRELGKTLAS